MSATAIIQARMHSARLPGKPLANIAGVPMLKRVIDRLRAAKHAERIVVATCDTGGQEIADHCRLWKTECHVSGKEYDVLGRFVEVCDQHEMADADLVIRVCGDNPLLHPPSVDLLVDESQESGADYTGFVMPDTTPAIVRPTGYFAEVVRVDALRHANQRLGGHDTYREHVTKVMYLYSEVYSCHFVPVPSWYEPGKTPDAAVDTISDLVRVETILLEKVPR